MARIAEVRGPGDPRIAIWQGLQPEMANAFVALSETVYQHTKLGFRVAEAARIRIAHINGCLLCQNFRVAADLSGLMARVGVADDANVSAGRGPVPDEAFYAAVENWRESPAVLRTGTAGDRVRRKDRGDTSRASRRRRILAVRRVR